MFATRPHSGSPAVPLKMLSLIAGPMSVQQVRQFRGMFDAAEVVDHLQARFNLLVAHLSPRSLAGKPLAGFRATPDRGIIVLCGMIVSVIRFKNPLLHR